MAILGENSPNWGIAYLAITTMGAVAVPILPNFHKDQVHTILRSSGSKLLFCTRKLIRKIEKTKISNLKKIIFLDKFDIQSISYKTDFISEIVERGTRDLYKLRYRAKQLIHPSYSKINDDDLATIIYTSGTTGHSKGVMLSHKNLVSNLLSVDKLITLTPDDKLLSILPLSHSYECTIGFLTPIANGCSVYYLQEPPTAPTLIPALQKVRPTYMAAVTLIMEKIYKKKIIGEINRKKVTRSLYKTSFGRKQLNKIAGKKLYKTFGGKLKLIVFGGAPLSPEVERFLIEANFPYACGYGLTETSPLLTGTASKVRFQSPGPAVADVEIKSVVPDVETEIGEIDACGPNLMMGEYKDTERTTEVLSPECWFKTGDRGYLDKDGYLFIKGRSKNLILGPSGENIYPEEIDSKLIESEFVLEA